MWNPLDLFKKPKEQSVSMLDAENYDSIAEAFGMFTGTTMPGTMSFPRPLRLDYYALRERSWQAYTENELASAYVDRLRHFVINTGLRLQYEPASVLSSHCGVTMSDETTDAWEKNFGVYACSKMASLSGRKDLHEMADEAYLNTLVGGDILVILHVANGDIKVQHIDGRNLVNPADKSTLLSAARKGNVISSGVEYDKRGREVAYYVRQDNYFIADATGDMRDRCKIERIPAKGRSGRTIAFRPNRDNQRIGSGRGKPILSPVLQNLEITRRYKLAELLAAEVNAKLCASIEHNENSLGNNPLESLKHGAGRKPVSQTADLSYSSTPADVIAQNVTKMSGAMVVNMGRGQTLKFSDTKRPNLDGVEFTKLLNIDTAAAVSIPFEIAQMMFSQNYSASRAALEMFKMIISFERRNFSGQYYAVIAKERQRLKALRGEIDMPQEYRTAIVNRDDFLLACFEKYRFTGVIVPHIDPVKEVNAAISRIDAKLSTREAETETLGTGEFLANATRLRNENKILDEYELNDTLDEDTEEKDSDATSKDDK